MLHYDVRCNLHITWPVEWAAHDRCVCVQDFFSFALIAALLWLVASAYFEVEKIR